MLVARAWLAEGSALQELGDLKGSAQAAEEAKQAFAAAGDQGGVASALIHLGSSRYRAENCRGKASMETIAFHLPRYWVPAGHRERFE